MIPEVTKRADFHGFRILIVLSREHCRGGHPVVDDPVVDDPVVDDPVVDDPVVGHPVVDDPVVDDPVVTIQRIAPVCHMFTAMFGG